MAIALAVFEKKSTTVLSGITIKAEVSGLPLLDKRNIFAEYVEMLVENEKKILESELEKEQNWVAQLYLEIITQLHLQYHIIFFIILGKNFLLERVSKTKLNKVFIDI